EHQGIEHEPGGDGQKGECQASQREKDTQPPRRWTPPCQDAESDEPNPETIRADEKYRVEHRVADGGSLEAEERGDGPDKSGPQPADRDHHGEDSGCDCATSGLEASDIPAPQAKPNTY